MIIEHKGYIAKIEPDLDTGYFHGEVVNTKDVITFQGKTLTELEKEFALSIEDYFAFCKERKETPEKPFSGKFPVRTDPETHRKLFEEAAKKDVSMNALVDAALKNYIANRSS